MIGYYTDVAFLNSMILNVTRSISDRVAVLVITALIGGCAGHVMVADGRRIAIRSDEFRSYVDRVFRFQNRLGDELAFAMEDAEDDAQLASVERGLLEACGGLNELAAAQRDGRKLNASTRLSLARSVPDCEQAAIATERALRGP